MAATETTLRAVKGPAIGLIVTGGIGILWQAVNLLGAAAMPAMDSIPGMEGFEFLVSPVFAWTTGLLSIAVSALIIYGGLQLMKLRSYGLCLGASIVAMIPCLSGCCLLGLPFGIWAIVVMNKPEVKEAFS